MRLAHDAARAESLLREVALSHPLLWLSARDLLLEQLRAQGRMAEVEELEESLEKTHGTGEEVFEERLEVRSGDKFQPAALEKLVTDAVYSLAGQLGTVKRLWLLERKLQRFPEIRDFVLIFEPTGEACAKKMVDVTKSVLGAEIFLPGTFVVLEGNWANSFLVQRAKRTEGAEIFSKND